jgi:hypothetical protein
VVFPGSCELLQIGDGYLSVDMVPSVLYTADVEWTTVGCSVGLIPEGEKAEVGNHDMTVLHPGGREGVGGVTEVRVRNVVLSPASWELLKTCVEYL